jgi:hypothetical protein
MSLAIVSALLAAAGARTASRRAGSFAPAFMRRLALAMLGLSLVAVPAAHADSLPDPAWHPAAPGPAAASTQRAAPPTLIASARPSVAAPSVAAPLGAAPLGAAPSAAASPSAASSAIPPSAAPPPVPEAGWVPVAPPTDPGLLVQQPLREPVRAGKVEVRPGDSLWTIVARHLGPGATDLDIAAAWPSWYEANAGTIGADPDLVRPGQLLVPPR